MENNTNITFLGIYFIIKIQTIKLLIYYINRGNQIPKYAFRTTSDFKRSFPKPSMTIFPD